jgi:DNA ligase (NAD+)
LFCENEKCPAKIKEEILNYIQKSGIDDLSDKRLEEMINKGLVSGIPDLYRLELEHFMLLDKVKEKLATKMYLNIQKSKDQTLAQFISAIGVDGVSITKCEKIISQGYNTLEKMRSLSLEQMLKIEGFAEKSSQAFLDSIHRKSTLIQELLKLGIKVKADEINLGEGPFKNLKFCITGELSMGRSDFEKLIKKNGGVMVTSVSKNTNYLITNETESSSSKFVKAKDLGISIISEEKLLKMIEE